MSTFVYIFRTRVVVDGLKVHFYRDTSVGDVSKIDIGIALCHFHLTCVEEKISGGFKILNNIKDYGKYEYVTSWIK
ncbi:hypothetical protein [Clostridium cylindrosporum]|uniref:Uncharacterized protein n=1 Tax=Clostridium cylindrosporum DSM 605 TaxID=1121307 RepID=A0A0J8D890_CLOCY|nr:hypothetical protein [Clostridium cylindrosporum]KMT22275.1 hypothetical protein CLCY_4c02480 [Clostridium cylindrosporum DSM 605]